MSKHTPGPWRVSDHELTKPSVYGPDGVIVAQIGPWREADTSEANARLIASAPTLLEAAKALCEELPNVPTQGMAFTNFHPAWDHLEAAIAAAEGGG